VLTENKYKVAPFVYAACVMSMNVQVMCYVLVTLCNTFIVSTITTNMPYLPKCETTLHIWLPVS